MLVPQSKTAKAGVFVCKILHISKNNLTHFVICYISSILGCDDLIFFNFLLKIVAEFTRLALIATAENQPIIPTPSVAKISSYTSYISSKARGDIRVNQTTLQDVENFARSISSDEDITDANRNDALCIGYVHHTDREDPYFSIVMSTRGLLAYVNTTGPLEVDESFKVMIEGYACTVIGQSDADRVFCTVAICVSTNSTAEVGIDFFSALKRHFDDLNPKAYLGDAARAFRNAFISVFGPDGEQLMCFAHVWKVTSLLLLINNKRLFEHFIFV